MNKKNQALEPLMFIEQQTDNIPESSMQDTYSSMHAESFPRKPQDTGEVTNSDWKSNQRFFRNIVDEKYKEGDHSIDEEEKELPLEKDNEEDEIDEKIKNQTFTDLTLEQQVLYCTSTSSYIPKIICIIKTEDETIIGVIDQYVDGIVHIKPQRSRVYTKVSIDDIKSIRLAGF